MHDTTVTMLDGRVFCGPMWKFRPEEGYMTIPCETDELLYFRDMASAVTRGQRLSVSKIGDEDEIERARRQGWDGT